MITIYVRPKCELCEEALAVLLAEGISFHEVDISRDPSLQGEFGFQVPVVQLDGRTVFQAGMDPRELSGILAEGSASDGGGY